jgi:hypothetical protein
VRLVVLSRNGQTSLHSGARGSTFLTQCSDLQGIATICDTSCTLSERKGQAKAPA